MTTPDDREAGADSRSHRDVPWILESDVENLLTMPTLVAAVREAFVHLATGQAELQPRRRVKGPGMLLHAMSAADSVWKLIAWKNYVTSRAGARFVVALYSSDASSTDSLFPLAFFEADRLGQMRTGAATAVAVDRLTPGDLESMALFGSGWQAEGQLAAILAVRSLRRVAVYSRDEDRLRQFCLRMSSRHGLDVLPARSPGDAARDQRLVVTATASKTPVVASDELPAEGLFVAMGSNRPEKQELDADFVRSCSHVVVDHREACRLEAGELLALGDAFDWSSVIELGDLLLPSASSTNASLSPDSPAAAIPAVPSGRTLFKSVGLAVEDLAAAKVVWDRRSELDTSP